MRPFLGNITMESYGKSNCIGCHSRALIDNAEGESYNTDFMYFLSINALQEDVNFLTYMAAEPTTSCEAGGDPAEFAFDLTGAAANAVVAEQSIELLVGIELPEGLPDPMVTAQDILDPGQPWTQGGNTIELLPDASCSPGACQVDLVYPPRPGQRWRQYRSVPALTIGPMDAAFAARVVLEFENLDCAAIDPLDLRLWVSDTSQSVYANQVDGDYLDLTLFLLPEPPGPEFGTTAIPVLDKAGLAVLILALFSIAFRESRRH
jgi:hypothetical protein